MSPNCGVCTDQATRDEKSVSCAKGGAALCIVAGVIFVDVVMVPNFEIFRPVTT